MNRSGFKITRFEKKHQSKVRALILQGLEEHWGCIDENLNEDLVDIESSYRDGLFILAWIDNQLVGTGALIPEEEGVMRVARMSVLKPYRRQGIGKKILDYFIHSN
jgi:GNAT superfamily N-acetyltransferase